MTKSKKKTIPDTEWPTTGHFTISDIQKKYPNVKNITLRSRIKKALEDGSISPIGRIKPEIGRPRLVFIKGPATEAAQKAVLAAGILPVKEVVSPVGTAEFKTSNTTSPTVKKDTAVSPAPVTV
jgi:hypothetical protein